MNNGFLTPPNNDQSNSHKLGTTTPSPTTTNEPKITITPTDSQFTINYTESSRIREKGSTTVTITVNAQYLSGRGFTIDYSQFHLALSTFRMGIPMGDGGTTSPKNSGSFTLGPLHTSETFQLTYTFDTQGFNGMDVSGIYYQLNYNGPATLNWYWDNHGYH
jgi:hypothetical protein